MNTRLVLLIAVLGLVSSVSAQNIAFGVGAGPNVQTWRANQVQSWDFSYSVEARIEVFNQNLVSPVDWAITAGLIYVDNLIEKNNRVIPNVGFGLAPGRWKVLFLLGYDNDSPIMGADLRLSGERSPANAGIRLFAETRTGNYNLQVVFGYPIQL